MEQVWQLLFDDGIKDYLNDGEWDEQGMRLILAELLFRVRALEAQCLTMQSLLVSEQVVTAEQLAEMNKSAQKYLMEKDKMRRQEVSVIASSGISPLEWLNFVYSGRFNKQGQE